MDSQGFRDSDRNDDRRWAARDDTKTKPDRMDSFYRGRSPGALHPLAVGPAAIMDLGAMLLPF